MLFAVSPGEQEEYVALQIHNGRPYFLFDPQVHHLHKPLCVCLSYEKQKTFKCDRSQPLDQHIYQNPIDYQLILVI